MKVFLLALILMFSPSWTFANSWCDDIGGGPEVLKKHSIKGTKPSLLVAVNDDSLPLTVRQASLQLICRDTKRGDQETLSQLSELSNARDDSIRASALLIIGLHGVKENYPLVASGLNDSSESVRSVALDSLGRIACKKCIGSIRSVLTNDKASESMRINAIRSLEKIGDKSDIDSFYKYSRDSNDTVAAYATIALSRIGDRRSVPLLVSRILSNDMDESLRAKSLRALEGITGEKFGYTKRHAAAVTQEEKVVALNGLISWWKKQAPRYEKE